MKRTALLMIGVMLALTACDKTEPAPITPPATATALPTASAEASEPPDASPSPANHFTVDGIGPYQLGAKLAELHSAAQLDEVQTGGQTCPANTTARGKGDWKDIRMSFRPDEKIYIVINRSTSIPTPSGAWVGMTLAAVSSIYGPIGEELTQGSATAYLVTTTTGRGILFDLDTDKKVIAMIAGEAAYLKSSFLGGTDYC